jgi:hypothetical protein
MKSFTNVKTWSLPWPGCRATAVVQFPLLPVMTV